MQDRRRPPDFQQQGWPLLITWRLLGTLPQCRTRSLLIKDPDSETSFAERDRELEGCEGPRWLNEPAVADIVASAIVTGQSRYRLYDLHAWVVMPNHVHAALTPLVEVASLTRWLKGSTAREANRLLDRTRQPLWQDESWDHLLRNTEALRKCIRYIEFNPVAARLADRPERWRWSSASWQAKTPAPHTVCEELVHLPGNL